MTALIEGRLHEFDACFNFRDLGGYETTDGRTVRWRRLYRSDTLHRMTPGDLEKLGALGLTSVIDLRSPEEIADFGRLSTEVVGPQWHHHPIIESLILAPGQVRRAPAGEEIEVELPGHGYREFFGTGEAAVSVLRLIADSSGSVVFHCTAGKDRTGIIAAMVLDLLGVPDETIAADYALTEHTRQRAMGWIQANEPQLAALYAEVPPGRWETRAEVILGFLGLVREEFGSVAELVRSQGMTDGELDRLRAELLEG